jgi:hypothetical protein
VIHTGVINFRQLNDEVQLKNFIFNQSNYSTLSKIANHYSSEAGVNLNNIHNQQFSVSDEVITGYKGGQPEGEINPFNDGVYSPRTLNLAGGSSVTMMNTDHKKSIITIDLHNGQIDNLLNDKYNFISCLDHEGGSIGHLKNPEKLHSDIYKDQINKYSKKVTPDFLKQLKDSYNDYKQLKE